jgi:hypothetical protein
VQKQLAIMLQQFQTATARILYLREMADTNQPIDMIVRIAAIGRDIERDLKLASEHLVHLQALVDISTERPRLPADESEPLRPDTNSDTEMPPTALEYDQDDVAECNLQAQVFEVDLVDAEPSLHAAPKLSRTERIALMKRKRADEAIKASERQLSTLMLHELQGVLACR